MAVAKRPLCVGAILVQYKWGLSPVDSSSHLTIRTELTWHRLAQFEAKKMRRADKGPFRVTQWVEKGAPQLHTVTVQADCLSTNQTSLVSDYQSSKNRHICNWRWANDKENLATVRAQPLSNLRDE